MTKPKSDDNKVESPETEAKAETPDDGAELTPAMQAALDTRIARELDRVRKTAAAELEQEKARIEREARERKLLEDQNYQELYERQTAELNDLRGKLELQDLNAKTDQLLDKAGIATPELREVVRALPANLEQRADYIGKLGSVVTGEAERRVAERLKMDAPSRGGSGADKPVSAMTLAEKVELRQRIGDAAFAERIREDSQKKG
jgi:exonuclease VII large subunit